MAHVPSPQALLLKGQADPNIAETREQGTPLWIAAYLGHVCCLDALLDDDRIDVNMHGACGQTALGGAILTGNLVCTEALLLDGRADVNKCSNMGWSPLYTACDGGNAHCVKALLADRRTDVNKTNAQGRTSLWIAATNGHQACVEALLAAGADDMAVPQSGLLAGLSARDAALARLNFRCAASLECGHTAWTLGPGGLLRTMPPWVKARAVTAVLCLQRHLPPELVDVILQHCRAAL